MADDESSKRTHAVSFQNMGGRSRTWGPPAGVTVTRPANVVAFRVAEGASIRAQDMVAINDEGNAFSIGKAASWSDFNGTTRYAVGRAVSLFEDDEGGIVWVETVASVPGIDNEDRGRPPAPRREDACDWVHRALVGVDGIKDVFVTERGMRQGKMGVQADVVLFSDFTHGEMLDVVMRQAADAARAALTLEYVARRGCSPDDVPRVIFNQAWST